MDKLATLLSHFSLHADVFYTGNLCGMHDFAQDSLRGHLHVVKRGPVQLIGAQKTDIPIIEPTLVFLPRPGTHRLVADEGSGADVVCGTVMFGGGGRNPITDSLPAVVLIKLEQLSGVNAILDLMFEEAFAKHSGRQAVLDRLCEVLIIRLLRYCIDQGLTQGGTLAGLSDPRLAQVLLAAHADPARDWDLNDMAALARMSRARFAVRFREVIGQTPADYLTAWRIMTAQRLLKRGLQLKHVAYDVGYGSASALARAFKRKLGCSPIEWLKSQSGAYAGMDETSGAANETTGAHSISLQT